MCVLRFSRPDRWPRWGWLVLLLTLSAGCKADPNLPKTYPVSGKVVFTDGRPLRNGMIEFRSQADPLLLAFGEIHSDGSFALRMLIGNNRLIGSVAGEVKVTVQALAPSHDDPPLATRQRKSVYTVKPEENYFTIEIEDVKKASPSGRP